MNKFNTILVFIILLLLTAGATAQQAEPAYKIVGNEIVSTKTTSARTTAPAIKTNLTHTIKGIKFPVFKTAKGNFYILRTSKTNKEYKQYLKL